MNRANALCSGVAFRDETEALRARIEVLESELGEARSTIARMKGADESVELDALPRRPFGWKRRVRRFRGALADEDYEHLARLIPTMAEHTVTQGRAGAVFMFTSMMERIIIAPGEEDELVLSYDEYDLRLRQVLAPLTLASLFFLLNLGPNYPEGLGHSAFVAGLLILPALYAFSVREDKKRFAKGQLLFDAVGSYIERSLNGTHVALGEQDFDLEEAEDSSPRSAKSMEA